VTEINEYRQAINSKLLQQQNQKARYQTLHCDEGLKADENWMSANLMSSWCCKRSENKVNSINATTRQQLDDSVVKPTCCFNLLWC